MAGMAAARTLVDSGYTVTVLEARDQIGGRIRTDSSFGVGVDVGASFIHGTVGNPLVELAARYGSSTFDADAESEYFFDRKGKFFPRRRVAQAQKEFSRIFDRLLAVQEDLDNDRSVQSVATVLSKAVAAKKPEIASLLNFLLKSNLGIEFGADLKELSLLYLDEDEEFAGPDLLLPQGYITLINGLAQGLDVRTNTSVRSISHTDSGVSVETSAGSFQAERVIVCLPLGILKRGEITFSPELSTQKLGAIGRISMGVLDKFFLKFPNSFWQTQSDRVGYLGNVGARFGLEPAEYYTLDGMLDVPIIFGFSAGAAARAQERLDDATMVARIMATFRKVYGSSVPDPDQILRTSWATDPFAFGSYSFLSVGASGDDYDLLAAPTSDRLLFAGEATNRTYPGTVHGAYLSGLREANRIMQMT